jgi:hypothetical protein
MLDLFIWWGAGMRSGFLHQLFYQCRRTLPRSRQIIEVWWIGSNRWRTESPDAAELFGQAQAFNDAY